MGVYVITGGSSGIGAKTVEILKAKGHETVNIDLKGGDINANLATKEGRSQALQLLHERYPDGIDAMICNAGVNQNIPLIISLNYFGATEMAEGAVSYTHLSAAARSSHCRAISSRPLARQARAR